MLKIKNSRSSFPLILNLEKPYAASVPSIMVVIVLITPTIRLFKYLPGKSLILINLSPVSKYKFLSNQRSSASSVSDKTVPAG